MQVLCVRQVLGVASIYLYLAVLAGTLRPTGEVQAAVMVSVDAYDRGSFRLDGRHSETNESTVTGLSGTVVTRNRYRSFYTFDLTGLSGTVLGAVLHMELESFAGPYSPLTFDLFDVSTSTATLTADYVPGTASSVAIYDDLGTGNIYATQSVTATNVGQILPLTLGTQAEDDIQSALGGTFAIGAALRINNTSPDNFLRFGDDFDEEVGGTLPIIQLELILSDPPIDPEDPPLDLAPMPEPSTAGLIATYFVLRQFRARRRRRVASR